jgi:L,D-peptidoglycan transpeptidase YkuD (ErfK/YbiS/YcfS/YnhG family)
MAEDPASGLGLVRPDGNGRAGFLTLGGLRLRCALGHGGVRDAAGKREGDGATPTGLLPLRRVFYRADRVAPPRGALPVEPLSQADGWCDDPDDRAYNTRVLLPFAGRHEALWRADAAYDVVGVLGWNDAPVQRGRGSAIFLHLARPGFPPTEGCVALARPDLLAVLAAGLTAIRVEPG